MLPLLLALLQDPLQVEGLRAGESVRALTRAESAADPDQRYGRVVDATSGAPVAGATVEAWTEETCGATGGFQRVGLARTGTDGGFRIRIRDGAVLAEKFRVRAPGYLAFPGVASDLDLVRLMPRPNWTRRLQVLDLEDRPIPGARITSTYSCAHDVPAFDVTTDESGIAELPEYGLQDHTGELRVRAPGFAARKYVDVSEVPADPLGGHPAVLRLARQEALRARVLTGEGEPLAGRALHVIEGDGFHVPTTDERGAFAIDSLYGGRDVTIGILEPDRDRHVFAGALPRDTEVALRVGAGDWPDGTPVGSLTIRTSVAERLDLALFHPDGWAVSTTVRGDEPEERELPAGEILVVAGEPFGGFEPEVLRLGLAAGDSIDVDLDPRPEPELTILLPPGEKPRIVVQAGDRSIEVESRGHEVVTAPAGEPLVVVRAPIVREVLSVPAGEPLIVLAEGKASRRLALDPLSADATADLRGAECLLPPTRAQLAHTALRGLLRFKTSTGSRAVLSARGAGEPIVTRTGPEAFDIDAPVGYPVLLTCEIEGYARCATTTVALEEVDTELSFAPVRLASLSFENETGQELVVAGPEAESLDAVHPGPLSLVLRLADGRGALVSLELQPGERRTLRLRE